MQWLNADYPSHIIVQSSPNDVSLQPSHIWTLPHMIHYTLPLNPILLCPLQNFSFFPIVPMRAWICKIPREPFIIVQMVQVVHMHVKTRSWWTIICLLLHTERFGSICVFEIANLVGDPNRFHIHLPNCPPHFVLHVVKMHCQWVTWTTKFPW